MRMLFLFLALFTVSIFYRFYIDSEAKVCNTHDSSKHFASPFTNYPLRLTNTLFSWIIFFAIFAEAMKDILIHNGGTELLKVRSSDIIYVEAEGNYCSMYLAGGFRQQLWFNRQKFIAVINEQMKAEKPVFISVGRSFIVNLAYIYLINPVQGDLILYDSRSQIKLHASQEALNRLKEIIHDLYD
jgi:hypothetical protein